MRAVFLALTLPAALAAIGSGSDEIAQVLFSETHTSSSQPQLPVQERYDGDMVQRFSMEGVSWDRRDTLVSVLNVS